MKTPFRRMIDRYPDLEPAMPDVERAFEALVACWRGGGHVLICGNGGSAADSEHLVGELMKGYLLRRPVAGEVRQALLDAWPTEGDYLARQLQGALPAISLVSQSALVSAIANDVAGDMVYAQQVYGYGRPGDALVAISTSGNANNVLQAVRVARARGMATIAFTGQHGGVLGRLAEVAVRVPATSTAEIQERHLAIYHALCARIEEAMFSE
jgi:D-sedoheptulose 7-phosphate isomerase